MNSILAAAFFFASAAFCAAGVINVVHLGSPDVIRFEVSSAGTSQAFDLAHGGSSGGFVLPDNKPATLSLPNRKSKPLELPANGAPQIAVLISVDGGDIWKLIPGKPTVDKWSLRAINLGTEPVVIERETEPLEIAAGTTVEIPTKGKRDMAVRLKGAEQRAYDGEEPCAVIALIYRKGDAWQVLFVPDR